jgi:amino acid adenylation domain-containing protein
MAWNELTFLVIKEGGRLRVRLDYDSALYDQRTARQLLARLRSAWAALPGEPPLARLTAVTPAEHRAVTSAWQGAIERYPEACLHELVQIQAKKTPSRVAVACGTDQLTYDEINAWSNRLARRLRELGVGQETVVAVAAGRAAGAVAGMLAVLKAGGCYLPVDPGYPVQRLRALLHDSGATIMVGADSSLQRELPVTHVGLSASGWPEVDDADLEPLAEPRNLAYVIYTSGSTGSPKGVMVTHSSIVCSTHARRVGGQPPTVDLVTMPLSFDGSAGGMYWALTTGGTVVLPTAQELRDPHQLAKLAASWHLTHIHSVPSTYGVLLDASAPEDLASLVLASVGGEPLPATLVARHIATCPGALLLNDYGPTEGTVWASAHACDPEDAAAATVPIGRPLPNYRLLILDEGLRLVPPGIPGELYLGGDGTARGYLRNPALTAARFVPDPYASAPGTRLYRTGDLARHRPDGALELLGRSDDQVKVRGFRVELGEIQGTLLKHPAVRDAAVLLSRAGREAAARLVAFVVGQEPECSERSVRDWLAARLPTYMHPDRVVLIESLPRNGNGKIDSAQLLALDADSGRRR